jgi:hypothetical protein
MTSASVSAFAARGIAAREAVFGVSCSYQGHSVTGTPSAERDARSLRDGGFALECDRIVRVLKSALPVAPRPESAFTVEGKAYRIKDVRDVTASGEWILGLVQIA